MNIYQKLQKARVELQDLKLKKSGTVDFKTKSGKRTNFAYYELADFLPAINELCNKHGLMTRFSIIPSEKEKTVLTIINIEDPTEKIAFVSPTATSTSLGDPLKDLGSKITYLRRYLFMTAFEIVESDMVDSIKRDLTSEVSEVDVKKIEESKTFKELTDVCGKLKKIYKVDLITPFYNEKKIELEKKVK